MYGYLEMINLHDIIKQAKQMNLCRVRPGMFKYKKIHKKQLIKPA